MREEKRKVRLVAASLTPKIIFEDKTILVIDKPAGMVVNRAQSTKEETIQEWLEGYLKIKDRGIGERAGIVHRLDKETSGILVVAKNQKAFGNLQEQFKQRRVEKRYLALVHGKVEPKQGIIEAPITRSPFDRKKFGVFLGGRPAKTKYKVKKYYTLDPKHYFERSEKQSSPRRGGSYTLMELMPETGRTHQIRVHLKYINHPVVADEKYAGRKTARADRQWCPRQFLHAFSLSFTHPWTKKRVKFTRSLPSELQKALDSF